MKIGLVLECAKNGPDQQVCEYLIEQLRPDTKVVSVTLTEKNNLIARCGDAAAALLLQETCQRVVIVWDLYPPWRLENPRSEEQCRHHERAGILRSLKEAGVTSRSVHLVCISEELEAWLIADNRAIERAISRLTNRRRPRIREEKNPESVRTRSRGSPPWSTTAKGRSCTCVSSPRARATALVVSSEIWRGMFAQPLSPMLYT